MNIVKRIKIYQLIIRSLEGKIEYNPMNFQINNLKYLIILFFIASCAGTIHTIKNKPIVYPFYKNAYIISPENSQYIKFNVGKLLLKQFMIINLPDNKPTNHQKIGNTDSIIKKELEKYGISTVIGNNDTIPQNIDLIILYKDTWRWDFKKILDRLDIVFISPKDSSEIARSTFNIYKNKELHNFPSPEKEVPLMIKELLINDSIK